MRLSRSALATLVGFGLVGGVRLLTLPKSPWEWDEILFVRAVEHFDPLRHSPHPPGYPLLVGLGKAVNLWVGNPFASLVALSVLSSLAGYLALVSAFRRLALRLGPALPAGPPTEGFEARAHGVAVAGALLFHLSPAMLVYGPLALSDPPALMFLSLALAAAALLAQPPELPGPPEDTAKLDWLKPAALGASASAAVGCRPQLALAVLPMLAAALWIAPSRRRAAAATLAAFTLTSLLWFVPLLVKVGGFGGLLAYVGGQARYVLAHDAKRLPAGPVDADGMTHGAPLAASFLAHPWGPAWISLPVLGFAAAGVASLVASRRKQALPLAVLCGVELAFCFLIMSPKDGVRYALPSLLGVAFATVAGLETMTRRLRSARPLKLGVLARHDGPGPDGAQFFHGLLGVYGAVALFAAGSGAYAAPLLAARTALSSPPVQAARWAAESLPPRSIFLVDEDLAAHASYLLPNSTIAPAEAGMERYAAKRGAPLLLLAEGESGWEGAVTFRWPESDAFDKLTRGHYRVVSLSPIPPGRRYQALRGAHAYEPSLREAGWRWLEESAAIRLFPIAAARSVALTLGLPQEAPWPENPVTITVAGAPAVILEVPRGNRRTAVLPLPAARAVEIAFQSQHSFRSAADPRRLAVQLFRVEQLDR